MQSAATEWRRHGALPVAAALGYSLGVIHVYSFGAFVQPLQEQFGWTRAQTSMGLTIVGLAAAVAALPVGLLVDRLGPRRVALVGTVLMTGAFALLSTATGSLANWLLLWAVVAFGSFWVQTTVWTSAVASRFETSRGLAFAVTLSGGSIGAAAFPALAVLYIDEWGWRAAFVGLAITWGALVMLAVYPLFRGAQDGPARLGSPDPVRAPAPATLSGVTLRDGLTSVTFLRLVLTVALSAFTIMGMVVHLVPILRDAGADPLAAAATAAMVGLFSIAGRIGVGLLLDRFSGRIVGMCSCLVPVAAALLLLVGSHPVTYIVAAALVGLTLGAEIDVIAYLASQHFGLANFGALFGALVAALSLGTAFGPLAAGAAFDRWGDYSGFLVVAMVLMVICSATLAGLRSPPDWAAPTPV